MNKFIYGCILTLVSTIASAQTMVTVISSQLADSTGSLTNGTLYYQPTLSNGQPTGYQKGGGGASTSAAVIATVRAGVSSISLPDTTLTNPKNICFNLTMASSKAASLGAGYSCIQPHYTALSSDDWCQAGVCNLDKYIPNLTPLVQLQIGAMGPSNSLSIGSVTTLPADSSVTATITGTAPNQFLDLGIPQGIQGIQGLVGPAPVIVGGTATPLASGASPTISVTGTNPYSVNVGIPAGQQGIQGYQGIQGVAGIGADTNCHTDGNGKLNCITVAAVNLTAGAVSVSGSGVTYPDSTVQATKGLLPANNLADVASTVTARSNITAAKSGANADITALSGLTTPLTPAQGGAGAMTGAPAWLRFFGDGSQGAYSCTTGTCGLNALESWYSSFNVSAGATFSPPNGNGAQTIIRSTGPCTIAGTITVSPNTDSSAYGSIGTATTYGGAGGGGGGGTAAGSAGPGAVNAGNTPAGIAGGGAGGNGVTTGGTYFRNLIAMGYVWYTSGVVAIGGQQGGAGGSSGPAGGKGSNPFILVCPSISFTGTIDASGAPGNPSTANNMGASGGGGGGVVILSAETYPAYTGTILLSGGAGGSCGSFTGCGAGGAGGNGNSYKATIQ